MVFNQKTQDLNNKSKNTTAIASPTQDSSKNNSVKGSLDNGIEEEDVEFIDND